MLKAARERLLRNAEALEAEIDRVRRLSEAEAHLARILDEDAGNATEAASLDAAGSRRTAREPRAALTNLSSSDVWIVVRPQRLSAT
jgi:hypothetical protein